MIPKDSRAVKEVQKSAPEALRRRFSRGALPPCPVAITLRLIGNRWRALILQHLSERGVCAHAALLAAGRPLLTQKVLTENLRALEVYGLVARTPHPTTPPRVDYALTPLGQSLRLVLETLAAWGEAYRAQAPAGIP